MSEETNWFQDHSTEAKLERCYWRRVAGAILLGIAAALIIVGIAGCSSAP